MTRTLIGEWRVLTVTFHTVPDVHALFTRHRRKWMARSVGCYSDEVVREFYASYVATIRSFLDRRSNPAKQAPVDHLLVRGNRVDIILPTICRFLYCTDTVATREILTPEFDYQWKLIKEGHFQHNLGLRGTIKRWIAQQTSVDGEGADWVRDPRGVIKKANLTCTAKFIWLLVCQCLSPTATNNIVTWDRAVLVVALAVGFDMDISRLLLAVFHERDFKATTMYPFPCLIFELCRPAIVPIWNIDVLRTPTVTVDIGLVWDEANEAAPHRGPRVEVQPLGENLADTVEKTSDDNQSILEPIGTTPVESIRDTSTAPSSSRSTTSATLVPIARIQKLEAYMDTLLHHIHPWMQKSIVEAEERIDKKIAQ